MMKTSVHQNKVEEKFIVEKFVIEQKHRITI